MAKIYRKICIRCDRYYEGQGKDFCSNKCANTGKVRTLEQRENYSKARKGKPILKMRGENATNWKGGITPINHAIRTSYKNRQWICDVFQRDDYTCQICSKRGGDLHVDHIKKFSIIMKENNIKSVNDAYSCEELWNINNGRTLCIPCHKKITYGN